jgi:hypothetical protein
MAIKLLFYNLLIPIKIIEKKVAPLNMVMKWGRKCNVFHDEHLYHEGFMGSEGIDEAIEFWEKHGLKGVVKENDIEKWEDFCMTDMDGSTEIACNWIEKEYDEKLDLCIAWLKNKPKGNIYG